MGPAFPQACTTGREPEGPVSKAGTARASGPQPHHRGQKGPKRALPRQGPAPRAALVPRPPDLPSPAALSLEACQALDLPPQPSPAAGTLCSPYPLGSPRPTVTKDPTPPRREAAFPSSLLSVCGYHIRGHGPEGVAGMGRKEVGQRGRPLPPLPLHLPKGQREPLPPKRPVQAPSRVPLAAGLESQTGQTGRLASRPFPIAESTGNFWAADMNQTQDPEPHDAWPAGPQ